VPGQCDILVAWPAGNVLFPALLYESGLKPSLATTTAKASERVIADPPGLERGFTIRPVFRPALASGLKPSLATTIAKASERVIANPLGWGDAKEGRGRRPVSRVAGKAGWAGFGYDLGKGVERVGLFRKFVAPAVTVFSVVPTPVRIQARGSFLA
jgi:hypothetical protein